MKLAFFGTTSLFQTIIERVNLSKDLLVTLSEEKANKLNVSDFRNDLKKLDFNQIYKVDKYSLKSEKDHLFFKEYQGDLGLVLSWNRLIPENILSTFRYGCLGLHGTPFELPEGRGRSPVIWSISLGHKQYNYYLFKLTEGVDDGPYLDKRQIDINYFDDINTMYTKLAIVAADMINENVPLILEGKASFKPQKNIAPTFFLKRGPKDGIIDWRKSSIEIYNLIRAITAPYPMANSWINDHIIYINKAVPFSEKLFHTEKEGTIVDTFENGSFLVKTLDGTLLVTEYQTTTTISKGVLCR